MKRHEAEQEAKRLNREHPERTRFRWGAMAQEGDAWTVYKMARIVRDNPAAAATETKPAPAPPEPASPTAGPKPRSPQPRKPGGRREPAPPESGLKGLLRRRRVRLPALAVAVALAAWGLWALRLLVRPLYMTFLVRHPALTSVPLLAGGSAFLIHLLVKAAKRGRPGRARPDRGELSSRSLFDAEGRHRAWLRARRAFGVPLWRHGPVQSFLVCGGLAFLFAGAMTSVWTGAALYKHTDYGALALNELHGGEVRIKPYEVAKRQAENGLNSPTEHPTNLHIVKVDGRLLWTSVRDPDGFFRTLTKPTAGVMSVDATSSGPGVNQSGPRYDADFRYGPGMRISENIRWQVYKKKCYTCDLAEMTALPTSEGPIVIAPYIRYQGGWFVRRPTWGGVYVIHPHGRIEDLSPAQAAARPVLRNSGRIYPEKLARRSADAYKYKRGVWSRLFLHTDQLDVADTETNRQPFLQDFGRLGTQWVTTLKPHGETFTTAGVMTNDTLTGKSRVWLASPDDALIGNQRAVDIVRGENFSGIVFADPHVAGQHGRFQVVEPRQIFPRGRLQFLLSIIPDSANRVTMSVVVDAASQQVVAKFPASPDGDRDLIAYLRNAELPERRAEKNDARTGEKPVAPSEEPRGQEANPSATLRRLLRENRLEQRGATKRISGLKAQERDLLRLLRVIEKGR